MGTRTAEKVLPVPELQLWMAPFALGSSANLQRARVKTQDAGVQGTLSFCMLMPK